MSVEFEDQVPVIAEKELTDPTFDSEAPATEVFGNGLPAGAEVELDEMTEEVCPLSCFSFLIFLR